MEKWDLFDKNRVFSGKTTQRGKEFPSDLYRTVVHIAIINSDGKMLIQQRQPFKHGWPDLWDISTGGHVLSGETSSQGAQRELFEELGINIDFSELRPSLTVNFNSGFDDIYILRLNPEISSLLLQQEEVQAVRWATESEIMSMIDSGAFIPYHKSLISLIFAMKDHMGAHYS